MSAPTADRLVHDARIGPDDTPHEAATHLWAQVVASHGAAPGGPLGRLPVFDRVVLVLHDVLQLSPATVAEVLHADREAVDAALDTARGRLGLPGPGAEACPSWVHQRVTHAAGDPAVLEAHAEHAATCPTCRSTIDEDHRRRHRWWPRSAAGAAVAGTTVGASALGGTLAAAAGIVAAGVAVGALVGPMPEAPPPEPVVVDADPALPSDDEPLEGWPSEHAPATASDTDADGRVVADDGSAQDEAGEATDQDVPGTVTDTVQDARDTLDETVDDVTDTVDETTDEVTDTVEGTTDEVTDTLDDATGGATGELGDALDDTTSSTGDALDETVDDASDALEGTVDVLP